MVPAIVGVGVASAILFIYYTNSGSVDSRGDLSDAIRAPAARETGQRRRVDVDQGAATPPPRVCTSQSVSIRVEDASGAAVSGARVRLCGAVFRETDVRTSFRSAVASEDGRVTFSVPSSQRQALFRATVTASGYPASSHFCTAGDNRLVLVAGAQVCGRVFDEATGEGRRVTVRVRASGNQFESESRPDGQYTVDVPPGEWLLEAASTRYVTPQPRPIFTSVGGRVFEDIVVSDGLAVNGVVKDERDVPLGSGAVSVKDAFLGTRRALIGGDGVFRLSGLATVPRRFEVCSAQSGRQLVWPESAAALASERREYKDVILRVQADAAWSGAVTDANGDAVQGAYVAIGWNQLFANIEGRVPQYAFGESTTDADGCFTAVFPGSLKRARVVITHPDYGILTAESGLRDGRPMRLAFARQSPVSITVECAGGVTVADRCQVRAFIREPFWPERQWLDMSAMGIGPFLPGAGGSARFELGPGMWRLVAQTDGGDYRGSVELAVESARSYEARIVLERTVAIDGMIVDQDCGPVSSLGLQIAVGGELSAARTDSTGRFHLSLGEVPREKITATVVPEPSLFVIGGRAIPIDTGVENVIRVHTIKRPNRWDFRVVAAGTGEPVLAGVIRVRLTADAAESSWSERFTGGQASRMLPDGECTIDFWAEGYSAQEFLAGGTASELTRITLARDDEVRRVCVRVRLPEEAEVRRVEIIDAGSRRVIGLARRVTAAEFEYLAGADARVMVFATGRQACSRFPDVVELFGAKTVVIHPELVSEVGWLRIVTAVAERMSLEDPFGVTRDCWTIAADGRAEATIGPLRAGSYSIHRAGGDVRVVIVEDSRVANEVDFRGK